MKQLSSDWEASRAIQARSLKIQYFGVSWRIFIVGTYATARIAHCRRIFYFLYIFFPTNAFSKRSSKHRKFILHSVHLRSCFDVSLNDALLGTNRSTRFDFNFNMLPSFRFRLYHHCWHKNVLVDFSASIPDAPAENSLTISLLISIRTNSLPSVMVQLLRQVS